MTDLVRETIKLNQDNVQSRIDAFDREQEIHEDAIYTIMEEKSRLSVQWGIYEEFLATYTDRGADKRTASEIEADEQAKDNDRTQEPYVAKKIPRVVNR